MLGVADLHMAEVAAQQRQQMFDIAPFELPAFEGPDRIRMPQCMQIRAAENGATLTTSGLVQVQLTQEVLEVRFQSNSGQSAPVLRHEQRGRFTLLGYQRVAMFQVLFQPCASAAWQRDM